MKTYLSPTDLNDLSRRELDVIRFASEGYTDPTIGYLLGLAPGTVGTYWTRLRKKTGLSSRAELASAYSRHQYEGILTKTVELVAEWAVDHGPEPEPNSYGIFVALPVAALVLSSENRVLASTLMANAILGRRPDEGADFLACVSPRDLPKFAMRLAEAHRRKKSARFTSRIVAPSGRKYCQWLAIPIGMDRKKTLLIFSLCQRATHALVLQSA